MDCYYGSGLDDLVVPEDQEFSDRLPSPDSWSKWGISSPEVFDSAKKFTMDTNEMEEDLDLYDLSLSEEVELETSVYDKYQSSGSSVCGGFPEQFYAETDRSRDSPNHQLQYLGGFEQMDDIFLHSVFEDLHGPETSKKSFCYSPESNCGKMPRDNLLTNISVDSDMHDLESSKYLKTHDFSPPGGLQKEDVAAPQFVPCNTKKNDHLPEEASTFEVLAPFEKNIQGDSMHEESSFQQSALHELELVMAQFTEETRICFRDALYRLARNSKQQQIAEHQDGCCATQEAIPWTDHSETTR
ncbi:protein LNK3-like isoform X1 [Quillaja saponaria]|nr:protein LNK3-like isoform X1 [Quillaja saponaria]